MAQITYEDKIPTRINQLADKYQVTADDMNMIKQVVNENTTIGVNISNTDLEQDADRIYDLNGFILQFVNNSDIVSIISPDGNQIIKGRLRIDCPTSAGGTSIITASNPIEDIFSINDAGNAYFKGRITASEIAISSTGSFVFIFDDVGDRLLLSSTGMGNIYDIHDGIISNYLPSLFGVDYGVPDPSAIVEMRSTTQGFMPPRMKGSEAEAISSPAESLIIYSTDGSGTTINSKGWWGFDGTIWIKMA